MGLFDIFKKSAKPEINAQDNLIYELLFCDNLELFKSNITSPQGYFLDILLSPDSSISELEKITSDPKTETRAKLLAYNQLVRRGEKTAEKKLLGVIVEVSLPGGLDVLAAYEDGSTRYINQSGAMIFSDSADAQCQVLINELFQQSNKTLGELGDTPWDKPRLAKPDKGLVRISFLTSNGLFFGHGTAKLFLMMLGQCMY